MHETGFNEFPTPILTASSPEGARDFLVPSRIHPGKFYALPQAPQQYKQLLMMSGFDRYFQIAPCFRDEDPRADRLPGEFYQLDVEMSFVEQEDVFQTMEPVITGVFEEFAERPEGPRKGWPRIPYDTAIQKYGSDKPDLRNPIEMQDVTEHFRGSGFKVFAGMIEKDPKVRVWAIPAPTGGSRAFCDRMNAWAQKEGQPGLGYIMWREEEGAAGAGPIAKNIGGERAAAIQKQLGLDVGDACFFAAGDPSKFYKFAGLARDEIGRELKLVDEKPLRLRLDRRLPVLRVERGRQEDRLLAQPVLDAEGRPRGAGSGGEGRPRRAARAQGQPVRHRLQRLRDRLGLGAQPPAPRRW